HSARLQWILGLVPQRIRGGATNKAPLASPNHHVNQMEKYRVHWEGSASDKQITPQVALTAVLRSAARRVNLKTSVGRSKTAAPLANRLMNQTATRASSVFPRAIPRDVVSAVGLRAAVSRNFIRFTMKAPRKTPGQRRYPRISSAERLMPVGGHTAVAL